MIDPTPEYVIDEINYTKHIDDKKYQPTFDFIQAAKKSIGTLAPLRNVLGTIMVSYDDTDANMSRKRVYFREIEHIALSNETH